MKKEKREVSIEIARIVGCLMVIGVHTSLSSWNNGAFDSSRALINCFFADGVALFWLICGCFFFGNQKYSSLLKRVGRSILIPSAVLSVILYIAGWTGYWLI